MTHRVLDLYQVVNFSVLAKLQEAPKARLSFKLDRALLGKKPAGKLTGSTEWPQS
jgi:hypothetical protein